MLQERRLQGRQTAIGEPFHRAHRPPCDARRRHQAGAHRLAVEQHRAGAAVAGVAAHLGPGQPERLAQHRRQPLGRRPLIADRPAIDLELEGRAAHAAAAGAGSTARRPENRPPNDLLRGEPPVIGRAAHVVDRRQPREMVFLDQALQPVGRALPHQRRLELGQPRRHRRAGADRDCRLADRPVLGRHQPHRRHGDRDDQVAPRPELEEGGLAGRPRLRHADGGDELVGPPGGFPVAEQKVGQRQVPDTAERTQLHLGVQHHEGRHAVGRRRGVAEVAGDGARVLHLHRADLACRRLQARRTPPAAASKSAGSSSCGRR